VTLDKRQQAQREIAFRALATAQNAIATAPDATQSANAILTASNSDLRQQTAQLLQAIVSVNLAINQLTVVEASHLELDAANTVRGMGTVQAVSVQSFDSEQKAASGNDPFGN